MATVLRDGLKTCVDCLFLIANGDVPPDWDTAEVKDWLDRIDRRNPTGHLVNACAENCAGCDEFACGPCDVCGSPLAGAMHRSAVLS